MSLLARKVRKTGHVEAAPIESKLTRAAVEKLSGMEDRLRGKITEHDEFSKLLPMSVEGQVRISFSATVKHFSFLFYYF